MITRENMARITVTLDPVDVDLLDRLAVLEGQNRSAELRSLLAQLRPMLRQTVEAFEAAAAARDLLTQEARTAQVSQFEQLLPEAQRVQDAYLGLLARLEGEATVAGVLKSDRPTCQNVVCWSADRHLDLMSDGSYECSTCGWNTDDDAPASNTGATD